jgi:hypothetical protein
MKIFGDTGGRFFQNSQRVLLDYKKDLLEQHENGFDGQRSFLSEGGSGLVGGKLGGHRACHDRDQIGENFLREAQDRRETRIEVGTLGGIHRQGHLERRPHLSVPEVELQKGFAQSKVDSVQKLSHRRSAIHSGSDRKNCGHNDFSGLQLAA